MRAAWLLAGLSVLALGQARHGPVKRGIISGEADERELKGTRVVEDVKRAEGALKALGKTTSSLFASISRQKPTLPIEVRSANPLAAKVFQTTSPQDAVTSSRESPATRKSRRRVGLIVLGLS